MSAQPAPSEPVFNIPAVVVALFAVMLAIQLWRGTLSAATDDNLVAWLAFVPGRLTFAFDPVGVMKHLTAEGASPSSALRAQSFWARLFLQDGRSAPWTLLTYAFLHGGWAHVGLNGVWMVAFGSPVARRFGAARFLVFMAVASVFGALAHWLCYPFGFAPVVGASAGISGLMGGAVRFMFQGEDRSADMRRVEPLALAAVFRDRRAVTFVAVWFVSNSLFGMGAGSLGLSDVPIAWQAHIGGFLAGILTFPWFDPPRPEQMGHETDGSVSPAIEPDLARPPE